jgi:CubicO group peptidase (beta-lactamase class C family)
MAYGDVLPEGSLPPEINAAKLKQAVNAAFEPAEGMTAAFVVTWRGRLIAERYGDGVTARTPLEGWSMGKSLTATMLGLLIEGAYELWQPAPIPEWQTSGDPRAKIRIADILQMSSGLRIRAPCLAGIRRRLVVSQARNSCPLPFGNTSYRRYTRPILAR